MSKSINVLLFKRNGVRIKSKTVEKFKHGSSLVDMDIRQKKKPRFSWIGGLKEFRDDYTSVELQEKALDWIVEMVLVEQLRNKKDPPR